VASGSHGAGAVNDLLRSAGPQVAETPAAKDPQSVPVLIVDDNPAKRLALKSVLTPLGYSIHEAHSGMDALRCVMAQDFAVILLDVCMPEMDGFETAGLIRQRQQSEMTPIIFITAYAGNEIRDANRYAQGAVDFMFAPIPPEELRAKVAVFANLFVRANDLAALARAVQDSADQLRLLTDAAPVGIFQTDAENRYVYTNPRWSEITGIPKDDAIGRGWDSILSPEERAGLVTGSDAGAGHRAEMARRFELSVAGSAPRIVLVTLTCIPDSDGGISGWVGTLADVTTEAGAEAAMSEARDKADEASRLKSDFLANMSHEIRTPMNGVIGMTDLLLETDLDAGQRDYAQTVRNSGEALLTIINDILDFSRIETGKLEVEDIGFDLRAVVDDVVALLAGSARSKGLGLAATVEDSLPPVVSGDPGRVRQVLTNLIGNAVKFTQAGEIGVQVTVEELVGADAVVRFEVSDTGDGIAPEKLHMIFQPFVQADTSTSRRYGGTGLGLAISSKLVALMGGECGVSSRLGAGSDFWFTIRVRARAASATTGIPSRDDDRLAGAGPSTFDEPRVGRLLLAEDNLINQKVAVAMLSGAGYRVDTVLNGAAAVEAAAATSYDAILMDCQMPELNGYEATAAIRASEGSDRHTSIIAITAGARPEDRDRCLAAGMDSYMSKPVSKDALLALVARSVRSPPAVASASPPGDHAEADEFAIDFAVIDELHALGEPDGETLLTEIVDQFVRDAEPLLVEVRDAVLAGDADAVRRIAHSLKGSASQLGGQRFASSCGRLEALATAGGLTDGQDHLLEVEAEYQTLRRGLTERLSCGDRQVPVPVRP